MRNFASPPGLGDEIGQVIRMKAIFAHCVQSSLDRVPEKAFKHTAPSDMSADRRQSRSFNNIRMMKEGIPYRLIDLCIC